MKDRVVPQGEGHIGLEVQSVHWRIIGLGNELIELLMLLLCDVRGFVGPKGLHSVDRLAIEENREANEVAVGLNCG